MTITGTMPWYSSPVSMSISRYDVASQYDGRKDERGDVDCLCVLGTSMCENACEYVRRSRAAQGSVVMSLCIVTVVSTSRGRSSLFIYLFEQSPA